MHGYSISLCTYPGVELPEAIRESLFASLPGRIQLIGAVKLELYADKEDDPAVESLLELLKLFTDGKVSREWYEATCNELGISPYSAGVKTYVDEERKRQLESGQLLGSVRLPLTESKVESIYADLVSFARAEGLRLVGEGKSVDLQSPGRLPPQWRTRIEEPAALPGFFISFRPPFDSLHWAGGEHDMEGAWCPNCEMPLMLYLTLDTRDERLGLQDTPIPRIPLLWCMRCCIADDSFVYRLVDEHKIEILRHESGTEHWREYWDEEIGVDAFPRREFVLISIPDRAQELLDKMNRWRPVPEDEVTTDEADELRKILKSFDDPMIARGHRYAINQVGGRPCLPQGLTLPPCLYCEERGASNKRMHLLAVLTDDDFADFKIAHSCIYVLFFICLDCLTIQVEHYI